MKPLNSKKIYKFLRESLLSRSDGNKKLKFKKKKSFVALEFSYLPIRGK